MGLNKTLLITIFVLGLIYLIFKLFFFTISILYYLMWIILGIGVYYIVRTVLRMNEK